jgi:hypothetical protein
MLLGFAISLATSSCDFWQNEQHSFAPKSVSCKPPRGQTLSKVERDCQENQKDRNECDVPLDEPWQLRSDDGTPKHVTRKAAIRTECVENNGERVAYQCRRLDSEREVSEENE